MSLYNKVRSRAGNEEQKLFSFHELSTFWHETADVILNSTFGLIGTQKQFSQVHLFDLSKSHHTPEKQAKEQKKIHMQPWKALEPNSRGSCGRLMRIMTKKNELKISIIQVWFRKPLKSLFKCIGKLEEDIIMLLKNLL